MNIDNGFMDDEQLENISLDNDEEQFKLTKYKKIAPFVIIGILVIVVAFLLLKDGDGQVDTNTTKTEEILHEEMPVDDQKDVNDSTINEEDLFEINKDENVINMKDDDQKEVKKEVKKTTKKEVKKEDKVVKRKIAEPAKTIKKTTKKISKIYVQVGAFKSYPQKKYIENIKKFGYKIKIAKRNIKNEDYYKVLVGPYKNEIIARENMKKIRIELELKDTYIFYD